MVQLGHGKRMTRAEDETQGGMKMSNAIRRNADGQQNLSDLRKALDAEATRSVRSQGGQWIITSWVDSTGYESPCPYYYDERMAIQKALFGEIETPEEAQYNARKAAE
jgi:hypothetical protein